MLCVRAWKHAWRHCASDHLLCCIVTHWRITAANCFALLPFDAAIFSGLGAVHVVCSYARTCELSLQIVLTLVAGGVWFALLCAGTGHSHPFPPCSHAVHSMASCTADLCRVPAHSHSHLPGVHSMCVPVCKAEHSTVQLFPALNSSNLVQGLYCCLWGCSHLHPKLHAASVHNHAHVCHSKNTILVLFALNHTTDHAAIC